MTTITMATRIRTVAGINLGVVRTTRLTSLLTSHLIGTRSLCHTTGIPFLNILTPILRLTTTTHHEWWFRTLFFFWFPDVVM